MFRKFLSFYVPHKLTIGILLTILGITWGVMDDWTFAWILVLLGIFSIVSYFLLGNIRLIQFAMEEGDLAKAQALIGKIKYPNLLLKPIKSMYHMLQSQMAMANKDFAKAEAHIKQSGDMGFGMKDFDGFATFQHGMIAFQKQDYRTANVKLKEALQQGLSEPDAKASANLMLCHICIQKRDNKTAKVYFKRAKEAKPKAPEIISQIKDIEKNIARLPG